MNTNLRERSEYGTQTRPASLALRHPALGFPEPMRYAVARRHWARTAAREAGAIAELMLRIWFRIVVTLIACVVTAVMTAVFDLEIVDYGTEG